MTREGRFGLRHDEGGAAHGFHAAGDHDLRLARLDGARGDGDRIHARTAQAVHRGARHLNGQARKKHGHARHVAVVLTGLVGAAIEHIVQRRPVDLRVALHQRLDGQGCQIVCANGGKRAAETADRRADVIADESFSHE